MPFFTAIAMYDTNHDNLFTDLFGPFQTYEIASILDEEFYKINIMTNTKYNY